MSIAPPELRPLHEIEADGSLRLNFHEGQWRAWESEKRFVGVLAGSQAGKTSWSPWWLWREIQACGPGDYIAVTATYDLFKLKLLPAIRDVFEDVMRCGRYWSGDRVMELADPAGRFLARRSGDPMWGRIILRSAEAGGGLESTTALAALLDEAGQDAFRIETWEAILRRLSLARGRALITTTLYNFDWIKTHFYDRWERGDPDYDVIRFDSTANPAFSSEEFERARASMPPWRFDLFYRGIFTRPAGMIYDCFRDAYRPAGHLEPRFAVPTHWQRYLGLDFGGQNTAGIFFAMDEAGVLHAYREYHAGSKTAAEHARDLLMGEPAVPTCIGGSPSEGQWRQEFAAAGLPVYPPDIGDVELGIGRCYGALKAHQVVFASDLAGTLRELRSYSRKLDSQGQPTDVIDRKSTFHHLDAMRYVLGWLKQTSIPTRMGIASNPLGDRRWGQV